MPWFLQDNYFFLDIAIRQRPLSCFGAHILQYMSFKAELYALVSRERDVYGFTLRFGNRIRLCDNSQSSVAFFVRNAGELQHDLVRMIMLEFKK